MPVSAEPETAELKLPEAVDEPLDVRFLGPLVTVSNVEDHMPLLAHVFGLEARAIQELDSDQVRAL